MKVAIFGSVSCGNFKNIKILINLTLAKLTESLINKDIEVVSGNLTGGELLGEEFAKERRLSIKKINGSTDVETIKNIVNYSDAVIIFDGPNKKYIQIMVNSLKSNNKEYYHYDHNGKLIYHNSACCNPVY